MRAAEDMLYCAQYRRPAAMPLSVCLAQLFAMLVGLRGHIQAKFVEMLTNDAYYEGVFEWAAATAHVPACRRPLGAFAAGYVEAVNEAWPEMVMPVLCRLFGQQDGGLLASAELQDQLYIVATANRYFTVLSEQGLLPLYDAEYRHRLYSLYGRLQHFYAASQPLRALEALHFVELPDVFE